MYAGYLVIAIFAFICKRATSYWNIDRPEDIYQCTGNGCVPDYMNWQQRLRGWETYNRPVRRTKYGNVRGIAIPGILDPTSSVNVFLGIPYARPPVKEYAFQPPQEPLYWTDSSTVDATYYRPACPQVEDFIQQDIPHFNYTNENCLYLNVFEPNRTDASNSVKRYPVMVFIHGGGFKKGSAIQYPGIILAQRDMIVVTFNYRLGPLGFLSFGDSNLAGNYGLLDQLFALRWIQDNIEEGFNGIKSEVTVVGHEAGAASIGFLMQSPSANDRESPLFKRAIMMSGSDLSPWALLRRNEYPREYAMKLSKAMSCGHEPGQAMLNCLRTKHPDDLVKSAEKISIRTPYGQTAGPFAPTVDTFEKTVGLIMDDPAKLRRNPESIMKVDVMTGFAKDDGASIIAQNFSHLFSNIKVGVNLDEFREVVKSVALRRGARIMKQAEDSIEFMYTWWTDPYNNTARRKMMIDMFTDELYASGVDLAVKSYSKALRDTQNTNKKLYMYKFDYRSDKENASSYWMGAYHGYDVQYLFGWPIMAQHMMYQHLSSIYLNRTYSELDRNISNGTMRMWKDFAIYGNPTQFDLNPAMPWNFRNLTWYPVKADNLTYFRLDYNSTNEREYHQSQLAFWTDYIYEVLYLEPYTTTPIYRTTYPYDNYQIAAYSLGSILLLIVICTIAIAIALSRVRHFTSTRTRYAYY